jgi:putative ABC transport system permease protein
MNTRWRKISGDFYLHRLQISLIGLVLMLGTAGVVAALNARAILQREIAASYQRAKSPDLVLLYDRIDAHLLDEVRAQPGVAEADARRVASTRVEGRNGTWVPTRLLVMRDFSDQRTGLIHQHGGTWPASGNGILIEQSSLPLLAAAPGQSLRIRTPGGGITTLPIMGVVHDPAVAPSTQERIVYAYVTPATAAQIGQNPDLDQLVVLMEDRSSGVAEMAGELRDSMAKKNAAPIRVEALPYGHPHAALMNAMLRVLGVMAVMAFTCSAALAAFVVSLWMKREVRQVGIMKTIGARSHQLAGQYLALVAPLVVVANALALPLGALAGRALVSYYETNLNIDVTNRGAPTGLWLGELLYALSLPLVAMTLPIVRAARMSAREAIHDPGITAQTAPRTLAAKLIHFPGSRQWAFALRNTFRRPWRLAVTLLALSTGGALLLTSCNLYESLMNVVDLSLAGQGHDIEVTLPRAIAAGRLESLARSIPGVEIAEAWRRAGVGLVTAAEESQLGSAPHRFALTGYPSDTRLLKMPATEGRWPFPKENDAIVITRFVQNEIPALKVGSEVTLQSRDRRTKVRVVGLVDEIVTPMLYANLPAYEAITGPGDASTDLRVKTSRPEAVVRALDDAFLDARIYVGQIQTRADRREVLDEHFLVVTTVAKMIALATALVGAICLAAFASLNVLERVREIGVIRTLGATPRTVTVIFLAESGAIAGLSALLAVAIALPATQALNDMTSRNLLQVAVPLVVSRAGLGWLGGGMVVVMLGVWLPVTRLLRLSVRDALAYE